MSIPAVEQGSQKMAYISVEENNIIDLINDTGSDLSDGDFAIISGLYPVIAIGNVVNGEVGTFEYSLNALIETKNIKTSEDTFATRGMPVFWSPSDKKFSNKSTSGYYYIGNITSVKDSGGVITFKRTSSSFKINSAPPGKFGVIEYTIGADHSAAVQSDFGFNFTVIDAFVLCTATNTSGTVTVQNSAGTAITNALTCATANDVSRTTSIAAATKTITDGKLKFKANGATDRGIVYITVKGA
jgi:hypothetical protein